MKSIDQLFESETLEEIRAGAQIRINEFADEHHVSRQKVTHELIVAIFATSLERGYFDD